MKAERDEDDFRPVQRRKEHSLITKIAVGVFIGQLAFWAVEQTVFYYSSKWQLREIEIRLDNWERNGYRGNPFQK